METLNILKALSDITRLRILNLLIQKEMSVNEIVTVLELGQSRISRHLKILSDVSLICSRKDGLWVFYRVSDDGLPARFTSFTAGTIRGEEIFRLDIDRLSNYIREREDKGREYFNRVASDWKRLRSAVLGSLDINSEILKLTGKYHCVADLGCGDGELAGMLLAKSSSVIGVDNSPAMLDIAGRYLRSISDDGFDLRLGELSHIPVRDGESDCAVINMVLHFLDDPYRAISESARIVKKGGRLIISELLTHGDETLRTRYGHRRLGFEKKEVEGWLHENGLELKKVKTFNAANDLKVIIYVSEKSR